MEPDDLTNHPVEFLDQVALCAFDGAAGVELVTQAFDANSDHGVNTEEEMSG